MPASRESHQIKRLFEKLCKKPRRCFPPKDEKLQAPTKHGVYIISKEKVVLHVGRTLRGKMDSVNGLKITSQVHLQSQLTIWMAMAQFCGRENTTINTLD